MSLRTDTSPVKRTSERHGRVAAFLFSLYLFNVIFVTLASAYSISDFFTCKSAIMEGPHDEYVRQTVFQDSDEKFFVWLELRDVSGMCPVALKLYRPDGTYFGESTNATKGVATWWRMVASWRIKNDKPAQTPGRWKLDLVIDGARQRSIYFEITAENPALATPLRPDYFITDFVTCQNAAMNPPSDEHVPRTIFQTSDDKFFAWVELKNVSGIVPVDMNLYRPDGTYHSGESQRIVSAERPNQSRMVASWSIRDQELAKTPGRWKLNLVVDGKLERSIYFDITPANFVPPDNWATTTETASKPLLASQASGVCIIEVSSDLALWTPIQTNTFPAGLRHDATTGKQSFRLRLAPDLQNCVVEARTDLREWAPFQTNALPRPLSVKEFTGAPVTRQFYRAMIR